MHGITRTLLFTIGLATAGSATLLAQHRGAFGGRVPLPSSTAIGAGALSAFPSSTSRATAPSFASPGFERGFGNILHPGGGQYFPAGRNYVHNDLRRPYRALPFGYVAAPYYYPFFDWGGDYSSAAATPPPEDLNNYGPDPATQAMLQNQAALGEQVQRLTDQVNNLTYGQQPAAQVPQEPTPPPIPLTVVLRDGQHLTVQNYAITASTLWDFTGNGAARKIPLANIDVAASTKATEANGGEFPQLGATR
jgi:hypothetical protein